MSTNLDIVTDALRELNVIAETADPTPEQGRDCLTRLNNMMQEWTEVDIEIGWFVQTSTSDTCPIPDWARSPVAMNLALRVASLYGAQVLPTTLQAASDGYRLLLRKSIVENLRGADMRHLPRGEGLGVGWDIETDTL